MNLKCSDSWCVDGKSYRLADFIRYNVKTALLFPGSIAHDYVLHSGEPIREDLLISWKDDEWDHTAGETWKESKINWHVLNQIISSRLSVIDDIGCVLSLRIGDIIFQEMKKRRNYVDFFRNHEMLKKHNNVTIVCGIHAGRDGYNIEQSKKYINREVNRFSRAGIQCDVRSSDPDTDFLTLVKASCLVPDSRGFGLLAGCLNNNTVIWDLIDFDNTWWLNTDHARKEEFLKKINHSKKC